MKLPSVYTDLCFKQIFENIATDRNSCCCSVVNGTSWVASSAACFHCSWFKVT